MKYIILLLSLIVALPASAQLHPTNIASKTLVANTSNGLAAADLALSNSLAGASNALASANAGTSNAATAIASGFTNRLLSFASASAQMLQIYDDFAGPDGVVSTNLFISEQIPVGRRLHIRGPGGNDTGTNVYRLNNRLLFFGNNDSVVESVYIAHSANDQDGGPTNPIRYVAVRFDIQGSTIGQTTLAMVSGSGVVEAGPLVHFGYNPSFGTADVTFHASGFSGVSSYLTFSFSDLPVYGPRSNIVFAWSWEGTNLWCNFGGELRYTNSALLDDYNWGNKTILQAYELTADGKRNIAFRSVAASTVPARMTPMPLDFVAATNGAAVRLAVTGGQTNDALRVVGPILVGPEGSSVIGTITGTNNMLVFGENRAGFTNAASITGQAAQHALVTGGVMFESGPSVNSQAEFILFANGSSNLLLRALAAQTSPQLQLGNVGLLAGSVTFTNLSVLSGAAIAHTTTNAGSIVLRVDGPAGGTNDLIRTTSGGTNRFLVTHAGSVFSGSGFFYGTPTGLNNYIDFTSGSVITFGSYGAQYQMQGSTIGFVVGPGIVRWRPFGQEIRANNDSNMWATATNFSFSGIATVTNGLASARTNPWTISELPDGHFADWWSNRTAFYRSFRNGVSITNFLLNTTAP